MSIAHLSFLLCALQAPVPDAPPRNPDAIVDLATQSGVDLLGGQWRVSEATVIEVDHRSVGLDRKPSGPASRTHDIAPKAGGADFEDGAWAIVAPESLEERRSSGRLSFEWYRIGLTIPERIGSFSTSGSTAVFEIVVDDYAEVWVDGELPQILGQTGGHLVSGWNAPNRVVVGEDLHPGQTIQLAIFAANAPLSEPPGNFIWIRSVTLDFYRPERLSTREAADLEILRVDPALDALVPSGAKLERVAKGFQFIEGPVWIPEGYLLFSDPNANAIHRWTPRGELSVYRTKSGYKGIDIGEYTQPGSNGLALDGEGRVSICEHGNRRVTRLEKNGVLTVLADRYRGKRLNSPNDLVYRSDGALFFTDPPFGLPRFHADPRRELPFSGVYRLIGGELELVSQDLSGPNGLAFSPDERFLYVSNWDEAKKVVMRYEVAGDGTLSNGRVFFDMGAASQVEALGAPKAQALDGLKVDPEGNLFVSGPGGVWVLSPAGLLLGVLVCPELPANFAFGDADGRTLYLCARTSLYRLRLGAGEGAAAAAQR